MRFPAPLMARALAAALYLAAATAQPCPPSFFIMPPSLRGSGAIESNQLAITADGLITAPASSSGEINANCPAAAIEHAAGVVSVYGGRVRTEYRWCLLLQPGGGGPGTMRAYFNTTALTSGSPATTVTCTPPATGGAWPLDSIVVSGWIPAENPTLPCPDAPVATVPLAWQGRGSWASATPGPQDLLITAGGVTTCRERSSLCTFWCVVNATVRNVTVPVLPSGGGGTERVDVLQLRTGRLDPRAVGAGCSVHRLVSSDKVGGYAGQSTMLRIAPSAAASAPSAPVACPTFGADTGQRVDYGGWLSYDVPSSPPSTASFTVTATATLSAGAPPSRSSTVTPTVSASGAPPPPITDNGEAAAAAAAAAAAERVGGAVLGALLVAALLGVGGLMYVRRDGGGGAGGGGKVVVEGPRAGSAGGAGGHGDGGISSGGAGSVLVEMSAPRRDALAAVQVLQQQLQAQQQQLHEQRGASVARPPRPQPMAPGH